MVLLREPDTFELCYTPEKPIPEYFALIIGDIIHNLRSSLDYWMTASVKAFGQTNSDGRFAMPFGSDRENLESQRAYQLAQKALPAACDFIRDEIQPYPDGNGGVLSVISRLNNTDKHNFILPTVAVTQISNIWGRIGTNSLMDWTYGGDAAKEFVAIRSEGGVPITIEQDFKTSVQVSFPKGSPFENEPVIPALLNCIEATSKALDRCEDFLISI